MGEGEKKPEEMKPEEKKPEEKKEEKKAEEPKAPPPPPPPPPSVAVPAVAEPPPPQEIVLGVYLHCEGCARKIRRCLKGFEGVKDVTTDCKTNKVVVKGEKADPTKVLERVQKKSHRQVELLSPIPKPPPPGDVKKPEEKEVAKPEPQVITVVLNVQMHCEACAQEIKKRILRMKGVENAEPDFKSSQVTVTGAFHPQMLIEYLHKRTGKHASIVKQEPEIVNQEPEKKKKEETGEKPKDKEKKSGDKDGANNKVAAIEKKDGGEAAVVEAAAADGGDESGKAVEVKKSEFYYSDPMNFQMYPQPQRLDHNAYVYYTPAPPRFDHNAYVYYPPAPQMFSDENPNACTVV